MAKESNIIKPYQATEAAGIWFTIPCCRIHTWLLWTQEYGAGVSSFSVGKMAWKQNMALYGELHELICASSVIIPSKHIRNKNLHTSGKKHLLSFSHLQGKCVRPIWTIFPVNIHGLMVSGLNLLGKHYKALAEIWEELNNKRACFAHTGNFTTKFFSTERSISHHT